MYEAFTALLFDVLPQHCDLIPKIEQRLAAGERP